MNLSKNNKDKTLVLFTGTFPYGHSEVFLETEINFLSSVFKEVFIFTQEKDDVVRKLPSNCSATHIPNLEPKNYYSLYGLFKLEVLKEISIIIFKHGKLFSFGAIKTALRSYQRALKIKSSVLSALKKHEIENTDYVFYSYWCDDTAVALGLMRKNYPINLMVARAHAWDVYFERSEFKYLPYRQFIISQLNLLFPISEFTKNYILNNWKLDVGSEVESKLQVERLGVNSNTLEKLGRNKTIKIVSCSTLIELKRIDLIINALELIQEHKLSWIHFGNGPEFEYLKTMANEKLTGTNVAYNFYGYVENKDLYNIYQKEKFDIFINVSSTEGVPISIMEAFASRIPVIATAVGGNTEIVNDENGILLPKDPTGKHIADSIIQFINYSDEEYLNKVKSAFETWQKKYDSSINYKRFCNKLLDIASA